MHDLSFLFTVLILLASAVGVVALFRLLHISPVLGYLVAGALIGPFGMGVIHEVEETKSIAEIGVVFLLFLIGLELSYDRLREMRAYVFGFGSLQVLITGSIIALVAWQIFQDIHLAILIGGGLAFSSTAIVLQILAERGEQSSQVGRLSLSTLLLQDFAVVPLLVMVPILASGDTEHLWLTLSKVMGEALLVVLFIVIVGRMFLRPFYHLIASTRSHELFMATTLLIVLGTSWATEHAGLSMALGAFIAGLAIAETEFQHQVETDMMPFKGLFLGLFFMTVGMSINLEYVMEHLWEVLALTLMLMFGKAMVIITLCRFFRVQSASSVRAGILLAQGSEFAFVLFALASQQGLIDSDVSQILLVVVTASMGLTPLADSIGRGLEQMLQRRVRSDVSMPMLETSDLSHHVIVAGYGRMGRVVGRLLEEERLPYVVLDLEPGRVSKGRKQGLPVYYGDAARLDVLRTVGAARADCIVLSFNDYARGVRIIRALRRAFPNLRIIARAEGREHAEHLEKAGAHVVITEALETALYLGGAVLKTKGVPEQEISRVVDTMRDSGVVDVMVWQRGEEEAQNN